MASIRKEIQINASPEHVWDALRDVGALHTRLGGQFHHYNGTAQVFPDGSGGTRFVWTADLLPNSMAKGVEEMIGAGIAIIKKTMESRSS